MPTKDDFYTELYPHIVNSLQEIKVHPKWADIVAAQAMIETSWGTNANSKINNFFGMKAAPGLKGLSFYTNEGYGNNRVRIKDRFLSFPNVETGVKFGVLRLNNKFNAFEGEPSVKQFVKNLNSKHTYFTEDPKVYSRMLTSITNKNRFVPIYRNDKPISNDATQVKRNVKFSTPLPVMVPDGYVKVNYTNDRVSRDVVRNMKTRKKFEDFTKQQYWKPLLWK